MNHSYAIFPGFYESVLSNGDDFIEWNVEDDCEIEYIDFKKYMHEVGVLYTKCLWNEVVENVEELIISDFKFVSIYSPAFYNYSTDKLEIEMEVDFEKLKTYCFELNAAEFENYLKENFTSRSGFISFVPNNGQEFRVYLENEQEQALDVMIEFYLLQTVNFEYVENDVFDELYEIRDDNVCLVKNGIKYECVWDNEKKMYVKGGEI